MNRYARMTVLLAAPLLLAALWMDNQPAYKAYETPVPAPPAGSVPISGRESAAPGTEPRNPVAATANSLEQGKLLFAINCALCHGETSSGPGPVGSKFKPPPPTLDPELLRARSDAHIFAAITQGFGRMPPFRDKLTPQERWHLLNFLRSRK